MDTPSDTKQPTKEEALVQRFLRGELSFAPVERSFSIWKTITLGLFESSDAYRRTIDRAGCCIGPWANDILDDVAVHDPCAVNLAIASVADLGFEEETSYFDICMKARELGLMLCVPEVGPMLRLQYLDQPFGEWLYIAMEAIGDEDDELNIFMINNDHGELWLCTAPGDAHTLFPTNYRFVFLHPSSLQTSHLHH